MVLSRTQELLDEACKACRRCRELAGEADFLQEELVYWHAATTQVCSTAWRRVMEGETVPNADKLFSLLSRTPNSSNVAKPASRFNTATRYLVIEDALGFICHYKSCP